MLDAAREVMRSTDVRDRADLESDHIWTLGLVKCIEIIREAAAQIGSETRETNPQIPWARIVAMRNRLVHAYFDMISTRCGPRQEWTSLTWQGCWRKP